MQTSTDGRGRRSAGGVDRDGRLHIAALANGRAAVRVLDSASLRADTVDRHRASSRVSSISVENEEVLGSSPMGKLARVGGNSVIAARELQQWTHEAMQMGALAGGGKGKGKARLGAGSGASGRPRPPQMPVPGGSADGPSADPPGGAADAEGEAGEARLRQAGPRFVGIARKPFYDRVEVGSRRAIGGEQEKEAAGKECCQKKRSAISRVLDA